MLFLSLITGEKIVLLVTKAVGDFFGKSGIADEMIRFNGYPFLDKEDHAFHIPGKSLSFLCAITFGSLTFGPNSVTCDEEGTCNDT
jgi:hypothetical protein